MLSEYTPTWVERRREEVVSWKIKSSRGSSQGVGERRPSLTVPVRRDQVAAFIAYYSQSHGQQCPSLQEIADALHISRVAVYNHLTKLVTEGRAERRDGKFWLVTPPVVIPPLDV